MREGGQSGRETFPRPPSPLKKWTRNGLMMGLLIFLYVFRVCMLANKGRGLRMQELGGCGGGCTQKWAAHRLGKGGASPEKEKKTSRRIPLPGYFPHMR